MSPPTPVYLDHNATAPLGVKVAAAMAPWLAPGAVGNPMSAHQCGRRARKATRQAATQVARALGVAPRELTFTSGATEANHLALRGAWQGPSRPTQRSRILVSAGEHPSVRAPAEALGAEGAAVEILPLGADGLVPLRALEEALDRDVWMVSIQAVNSETGAIQPLAEFAPRIRACGAWFHSDVTQAPARLPLDLPAWGLDLASLSSHKIGGPPGIGALWSRPEVPLHPLLLGGGHQGGRRAGSEPVALLVGMGAAYDRLGESGRQHLRDLDARLREGLGRLPGVEIAGDAATTAPGVVNLAHPARDGETLLMLLDQQGYCVSNGPACASGAREPSPTLQAMGLADWRLEGAIRVSLGAGSTEEDVDGFLTQLARALDLDLDPDPTLDLDLDPDPTLDLDPDPTLDLDPDPTLDPDLEASA